MPNTPGFDFEFTQTTLEDFLNHLESSEKWYRALCVFLPEYEINTKLRVAAFLAQTHHESAGFRHLSENLNYRWQSLRRTWPKHFPTDAVAQEYAHKPERIANRAYANRMGNGNEASGDGWRYRGQGLIQLTGRHNQARFAEDSGIPLEQVPEYLGTFDGAVHSACWFWSENNLNHWADRRDMITLTRRINGGENGLDDRIHQYNRALKILNSDSLASSNLLKRGDRGERVRQLQLALGITADGDFGPATERSLREWQEKNNITADGIAGPDTISLLLGT